MSKRKRTRRHISLGTIFMLACTIGVLTGFVLLMPSFTGNQDILIDAARLAVAMDDSLTQLSTTTTEILQQTKPQQTIIPPFTSQNGSATAAPTATPAPTQQPKRTFTLCAGGSIEWNTSVRKALTIDKEPRYDLLTDQVIQAMTADLSIVTLQNTISASNDESNVNMTASILPPLRAMGINAINLGHTNALNYGMDGIRETASAIQNAGLMAFGATEPAALQINGVNIALLHYQDKLSSTGRKQMDEAERNAVLFPIDLPSMLADIAAVREKGAHVVIVTLWWGEEGRHEPTDEQCVQAQALADAGADIILGAGTGSLQPVQVLSANRGDGRYHPVLCAYSLGNLFSPDRESRVTLTSVLLKANVVYDTFSKSVAFENLTYTPTYAWRGKDQGQTLQRILINDPDQLPDFVDSSQQGVMERCMALVTEIMADTTVPISD